MKILIPTAKKQARIDKSEVSGHRSDGTLNILDGQTFNEHLKKSKIYGNSQLQKNDQSEIEFQNKELIKLTFER